MSEGARAMTIPRGWFYGWVVVAASAVGLFLGAFPIVAFSFGVFFQSFAREFHAGRAAVSLAFAIHNLLSGMCAVVVGRLADRLGARKVILPGLVILGLMLVSAEAIGSRIWELYLFYAVLGVVGPATTSVPYALVVSRWFDRRRGLALGVMMVGLGAGAIAMPVVAQHLIAGYGWRSAFAIVGGAILLVPLPVVGLLLEEGPAQMGLVPDGITPNAGSPRTPGPSEGVTWGEARRSALFWSMVTAFVLLAASVHACVIHLPELLGDRGSTRDSAVLASSLAGLALLAGRIGCGYFLDRYFGPHVALVVCAGASVGIGLLATGRGGGAALAGAFLVGLGLGAEVDIIAFLMSRYFGLRALGTTMGFAFGAFVIAGGLGPLAMGFAFDRTGSYGVPLAGFCAATIVAAALMSRLGPYRFGVPRGEESSIAGDAGAQGRRGT